MHVDKDLDRVMWTFGVARSRCIKQNRARRRLTSGSIQRDMAKRLTLRAREYQRSTSDFTLKAIQTRSEILLTTTRTLPLSRV